MDSLSLPFVIKGISWLDVRRFGMKVLSPICLRYKLIIVHNDNAECSMSSLENCLGYNSYRSSS